MSIAIIAAAAISEFFTALVITLFVLIAEVLEDMTVSRGRRAISDLLEFLPNMVSVRRSGNVSQVATAALAAGDIVFVVPGERVPVDGTVVSGHSFIDQAHITGESAPVEKIAGSAVYAGTINQSGALEIRTERIGRDTSYGKIIEAVEHAERSRAPVQRLADRLAAYLVYFALGAAALTFLITRDVRSMISVVIVAGACGVAAGTPLAILGGIGRSARLGAIIKGGLLSRNAGAREYGGARQDRHAYLRPAGGESHSSRRRVAPKTTCWTRLRRLSCDRNIRLEKLSSRSQQRRPRPRRGRGLHLQAGARGFGTDRQGGCAGRESAADER